METVPRAGWQHPGRGAASPPHGSRWARGRELVSCAPHSPPGPPNARGNESGIISAPFGGIPPLLSLLVPFLVEHPSLLQPWLPTLKDSFNTSQAWINGKLGMFILVGLQGWGGQGEGGEVRGRCSVCLC